MYRRIVPNIPFGPVVLVWTMFRDKARIVRVLLSKPGSSAEDQSVLLFPNTSSASCVEVDALALLIAAVLEGEDSRIPLEAVALDRCSTFQQSVLRAEYGIPRGRVSTYRLIAEHVGHPNGARAVGTALARNPFPLIVPCHRAVRTDGHPGGFQGGLLMKRALLRMEGVQFDEKGRVICDRLHYRQDGN
jgi:methylated-DNA-[protein]-cysteine S-methyltransferase